MAATFSHKFARHRVAHVLAESYPWPNDARLRAEWYARGDYYAAQARSGRPIAKRDPLTGREWAHRADGQAVSLMVRAMSRAGYAAMARAAYENARAFPCPLPQVTR